jgi:hypothetical protein
MTTIPPWITITLGIIAILAPVASGLLGGWIVARRDDRRWERERQKEMENWRQDRDREENRYWRERRTQAYVSAINAWREFNDKAAVLAATLQFSKDVAVKSPTDSLAQLSEALRTTCSLVQVEGSAPLIILSLKAEGNVAKFMTKWHRFSTAQINVETAELKEDAAQSLAESARLKIQDAESDSQDASIETQATQLQARAAQLMAEAAQLKAEAEQLSPTDADVIELGSLLNSLQADLGAFVEAARQDLKVPLLLSAS